MITGLPDRPLSYSEAYSLSDGEEDFLAIPGALESLRYNDEGERCIYDLIVFADGFTAAISYVEADEEWIVVSRKTGEEGYEEVHQELVEYRGYESSVEMMREAFLDAVAGLIADGEIDKAELEQDIKAAEDKS